MTNYIPYFFFMVFGPNQLPITSSSTCNSPCLRHGIQECVQGSVNCLLLLVFPGDHLQAFKAMQAAKTLLTQRFCQSAGATFQRRKMHPRSYARIVVS